MIRTVGRNLLRFVYALVVFGVLLVGSAYVLWIYERPIEERTQLAEVEERSRWGNIIARLFKFVAVPNDEGLVGTDCATAYLDHPTISPASTSRPPDRSGGCWRRTTSRRATARRATWARQLDLRPTKQPLRRRCRRVA